MMRVSNGVNKLHDSVTVFLRQLTELLYGMAGVALGVAVPHDGFDDSTRTAVVQTVAGASADGRKTPAPQRRGTAPTGTNVVFHVKLVLDIVAVRPDLLVGIARQACIAIAEEASRISEVIVTRLP